MTDLATAPRPVSGAPDADPKLKLKDVIDAVPAEFRQRSTARGLTLAVRDIAVYALTVWALIVTDAWWATLLLWPLAGLAVAAMFIAGHDAAHGTLTDSNRLNSWLGHVLFLPSLHNFESWVLGHNRVHHAHTVKENVDFVWHPLSVDDYRALGRFGRLRHRLEWSLLGAGVYYTRDVWWQKMIRLTDPPARFAKVIKRDARFLYTAVALGAAGLAIAGGALDGAIAKPIWLVIEVIVVPAFLFMWVIGWAVYVHHIDVDIRWHHRHDWDKVTAQLDGTTVLRVRKPFDFFLHNIFVHMPHHVDMRIPCYHLRGAAEAIKTEFPGRVIDRPLRFADYRRNTRACKLYDFDNHTWLTYDAAR